MKITRRRFFKGATVTAVSGVFLTAGSGWLRLLAPAAAQPVSQVDLMAPNPLGEMALGSKNAPVTIIEYASMTCSHCANFHNKTYPELKKRYIDTGKVHFIFREFPLDPLAAAASMLARCAAKTGGPEKYFAMAEVLFHQQSTWAVQQPIPPLLALAKQAGFTEASFEECLSNQPLLNEIEKVRNHAAEKLGVNSTPTFFINGKIERGALSIEQMSKLIDAYLKS